MRVIPSNKKSTFILPGSILSDSSEQLIHPSAGSKVCMHIAGSLGCVGLALGQQRDFFVKLHSAKLHIGCSSTAQTSEAAGRGSPDETTTHKQESVHMHNVVYMKVESGVYMKLHIDCT